MPPYLARLIRIAAAIAVGAVTDPATIAAADNAYFAGKQIRIVVPSDTAGAYALYAQLAVSHLARFIPGQPNIIVSYMPGAGGLRAMNYLDEAAARDGTVIAVPIQDLASRQAIGTEGVRYDATKFTYLARATANVPVHMAWYAAKVRSLSDVRTRTIITGATGTSGTHIDLPRAQNSLIGTKWQVISGYKGINEARIAMERGEVQAVISPATLFNEQLKPWLEQGKVQVLVQYADFRHPIFPQVPTIIEVTETAEAKSVFKFLVSLATVGRAYVAPPNLPTPAVEILRTAFMAMLGDPAFRADAEKRGADLLPMSGQELGAHINDVVTTTPDIVRLTKDVIGTK